MFDLEKAIKDWRARLSKHRAFDEGVIQEMEQHLRDHVEDLVTEGIDEAKAFESAAKSFGDVPEIAAESYSNIQRNNPVRKVLFSMMLHNYFKTATRSMLKNPLTSFINIFGLAVAIGACMISFEFMEFDLSTDRFHEHNERIFLSTYLIDREGQLDEYGNSPAPLGAMLREDFSGIEQVCRIQDAQVVAKYEDRVFHENVRFVDEEFLEMFTFPLVKGSKSALSDPNSVILSHSTAEKYFGDRNPLGSSIKFTFYDRGTKVFRVAGVAEEFPKAHIIGFDFLVHFDNLELARPELNLNDWDNLLAATFIKVSDPGQVDEVKTKMNKYQTLQNEAGTEWPIKGFGFVSLHDLHLASDEIRDDISYDSSDEGRIGLPVITLFILILACLNYVNIAIVSATRRLKEIGIRKVAGANKRLIFVQFLTENILITFLAGIIGVILAITVFLPWFSAISDITSTFNFLDPVLWIFLFGLLFLTGLVSGMYPAFYISRFQAVSIFRGNVKFGRKNQLTKAFLAIQLALACSGISFAVVFDQNSRYQEQRSWGYDQAHVLYAELHDPEAFGLLKQRMEQEPEVLLVAGSRDHFSKTNEVAILKKPDREFEVVEVGVDDNYLSTMGIEVSSGRTFLPNQESEARSIVVNEFLIKTLNLEHPIGHQLKKDTISYRIVGVVPDFHYRNLYYEQEPTFFTLSKEETYRYLSVKVVNGKQAEMFEQLQRHWSDLYPEIPFNGGFQEDTWPGFYEELNVMQRFTRAVAAVFIILACLGLYGLISLNISGRIKEFSIRKTLGAGFAHLGQNIASQYYLIFVVAIALGIPMGHMLNKGMLEMMFPETKPFLLSGSMIGAVILLFILGLVLVTQVRKVTSFNPVKGLKEE